MSLWVSAVIVTSIVVTCCAAHLAYSPHHTVFRSSYLFLLEPGSFGAPHVDSFGSAFWQFVVEGAKEWHIVDAYEDTNLFPGHFSHYRGVVHAGESRASCGVRPLASIP